MLQQILRDMTIDPELLAELSDEQKQILFVKIREEQVRRWKVREDELEQKEKLTNNKREPRPGKKQVQFKQGRDGNDWVWVMGEHPKDKAVEQILEEEAQARALKEAEKEAESLRKQREKEIAALEKKLQEQKIKEREKEEELRRQREEAERHQSIQEARLAAERLKAVREQEEKEEKRIKEIEMRTRRQSVKEADTIMHRRSTELYTKWKEMREQMLRKAEANSREVEEHWQEQEKKAKEAETRMRDMARTARIEYQESLRRTTNLIKAAQRFGPTVRQVDSRPPVPPKKHLMRGNSPVVKRPAKPRPTRPPSREAVLDWFSSEEQQRGAGYDGNTGQVAEWFHGIISRDEAERLIRDKAVGSFLVRVSERVWGYTISFKDKERCKHFLIDTSEEGYQFLGANQILHGKLADLIEFHKETPITISGQEKLLHSVGQEKDPADYAELFTNRRSESTSL